MSVQTQPLAPAQVEEGKTLRSVIPQGWDPRIHVAECDKLVRSFLICSERYVILHDTMLGPASGLWLKAWAEHHLGNRQLLVYNSHADWDHYWGNQVFSGPILGSSLSPARVKTTSGPKELERKRSEYAKSYADVRPTAPSILFNNGGVIDGGDLTFHFLPTPGHRSDHLSLWIPEIATLFPADSMEDPFPLFDDDFGPEVIEQEANTLRQQIALKAEWIFPCHAEPQKGSDLLQANLHYVERLQAAAQETRERGDGLAGLAARYPNPAPQAPSFYQEEHDRALKLVLCIS